MGAPQARAPGFVASRNDSHLSFAHWSLSHWSGDLLNLRLVVGVLEVPLDPRIVSQVLSFYPSSFYIYMVQFHFKKHLVKTASQELLEGLQQLSSTTSPGVCFKDGQNWEERLGQVCVPIIFSRIYSK